jgi:hypothetical protein
MKKTLLVIMGLLLVLVLVGCTQADRVSHNISKEADAFNVMRRLTVLNARSDKPMFELVGQFSLANNSTNELTVTVQTGPDNYKKHFIYLNPEWTLYVVEDLSGADVTPYYYDINFLPEMIIPFGFSSSY